MSEQVPDIKSAQSGDVVISIIIPVYNVESHLVACLDSVVAQSMPVGVECIIVNDCSTDGSMDLYHKYAAGYKGPIDLKVVHLDHNSGPSAARNAGLDIARGEYIFFLDSDDEIMPGGLKTLYDLALSHPDAQIVCGNLHAYGVYAYFMLPLRGVKVYADADVQDMWFRERRVVLMAWNQLIKRDFIESRRLRFAEGLLHEDVLWHFDIGKHVTKFVVTGEKTYNYHPCAQSIMSVMSPLRVESTVIVGRKLIEGLDTPLRKWEARILTRHLAGMLSLHNRYGATLGSGYIDDVADLVAHASRRLKEGDSATKKYRVYCKMLERALKMSKRGLYAPSQLLVRMVGRCVR